MGLKKVSKSTKRVKTDKNFGKHIAQHKKNQRIKQVKEDRVNRSMKAEANASKKVPVLERTDTESGTVKKKKKAGGKAPGFQEEMKVDDFLEGGFEAMMDAEDEDQDEEEEAPAAKPAKAKKEPKAKEGHKAQLAKLKESDPAFYEYLQKTDKNLLQFDEDDEDEDDNDDEEEEGGEDDEGEEDEGDQGDAEDEAMMDDGDGDDDGAELDTGDEEEDDEEEAAPPPSRQKQRAVERIEVTADLVRSWEKKLLAGESAPALRQLVSAFRCAVHYGDEEDDDEEEAYPYSFTSAHVFNMLVQLCLTHMDSLFRRHAAGGADAAAKAPTSKSGVEQVSQWPHWKKLALTFRSYVSQLSFFLQKLTDPQMLLAVLQQVHRMVPFYLALNKLVPKLLRQLVKVWSTGGNKATCLLAFAIIRQLAAEMPEPFADTCLKATYLAFAQMSRATNRKTLQRVALLSSCYVDLCALDPPAAYQHAFVYIRQLAIHLRNAIQKPTADAYRQVYNWQYINCLRLWAQVLCAHGRSHTAPLRPLLYPLVQVVTGAARLLPNIRFAPLRLQCVRILNQLSAELGVYVPVAPLIFDCFKFSELSRTPAGEKTERLLDWAVMIKVSKADASRKSYQEGLVQQALFALAEHLNSVAYTVAFPELAVPVTLALRAAVKATRISTFQKRCKSLLAQLDAQAQWVARKRSGVDFAPKDKKQVSEFLAAEREAGAAPYTKWFATQLAEAAAAEALMRDLDGKRGGGDVIQADKDDDDDDDGEIDDEIEDEDLEWSNQKTKKKKGAKRDAAAAGDDADGRPAKKGKKAAAGKRAAADTAMNDGDDVVQTLQLSDSDDDGDF